MSKPLHIPKLTFVRGSELKPLSALTPWKSLLAIASEWILIGLSILLHLTFTNTFVYLISWFIIATRLYAIYSLIHDAVHYLIVRDKKLNDIISQITLGIPIFISLIRMRGVHLAHHKYLQTEKDPEMAHLNYQEFQYPKSKSQLLKLFLFDLLGINFAYYQLLKVIKIIKSPASLFKIPKEKAYLNAFYFLFFSVAFVFGFAWEVFIYWIVPFFTLYQVLNRLRLSTEHFNIDEDSLIKTRSVIPSFLESFFIAPHNIGYHLDHHLYPGIPFYNLPKLHKLLMKHTEYKATATTDKSYSKVIKNCIQ